MSSDELMRLAAEKLDRPIHSMQSVAGGRNNRVFKFIDSTGRRFVLKSYFRHESDQRDRLGVEFNALAFMWTRGIRCIPEPILCDHDHGIAIHSFVEGAKVLEGEIGVSDIDALLDFVSKLKEEAFRDLDKTQSLPIASEACFSIDEIIANIQGRVNRLIATAFSKEEHPDLRKFLDMHYLPLFRQCSERARSAFEQPGLSASEEIPLQERTLSPSDIGFHNALKDKGVIFLDFEYFGWDDPCKMVSDFLLQPEARISNDLKQRYVQGVLRRFASNTESLNRFSSRLRRTYPLFGLKWCMILLNEFLPDEMKRRMFSGHVAVMTKSDREAAKTRQLSKAYMMLEQVCKGLQQFPYS